MRVTRLHVPAALAAGASVELPDTAAGHLIRVLRLDAGDAVRVFDGEGQEFEAVISQVTRNRVDVRLGDAVHTATESPLAVTLMQGVARGDKMDLILQKATELGVAAVVPLLAARSTVKLGEAGVAKRHAHWQGVMASACEQSGRARLPRLAHATELPAALKDIAPASLKLLLVPLADSPSLPALLALHPVALTQGVHVLVGPEGGFDETEIRLAEAAGFLRCRLGPRVLRTETAGLAVLTALQVLAGDWA